MVVKFNKQQIKALASIHSRAVSLFNKLQAKKPHLYKEVDRGDTVRCFELGFIDYVISSGEFSVED